MINQIYQLVSPKFFLTKYDDVRLNSNKVLVRPNYMSICKADQRYFLGLRDVEVLNKKLPMALIHEACGTVAFDPTNTFKIGQKVIMIPNSPTRECGVIDENYDLQSNFLSSGYDGFMREIVDLKPNRLVPYEHIPDEIAAITEFVSVATHTVSRFDKYANSNRNTIGIWGDGSLGYVVGNVLKTLYPNSKIVVVGRDRIKLQHFTFADACFISTDLPKNFAVDHAFECCGGEGAFFAIEDIMSRINPQGCIMLMGVSENKVAINTRLLLEKGLVVVGSSRSGRVDFESAIKLMKNQSFQKRLKVIINVDEPVQNIGDIIKTFADDLTAPFKTVFHWNM